MPLGAPHLNPLCALPPDALVNRGETIETRLALIVAIVLSLTLPLSPDGGVADAQETPRPNFVLIVTDDQRWDTIGRCRGGFDGYDLAAGVDSCMPFLQQELVANGTTFLRGYVATAVCCPSRASILTGLYSRHTGVLDNNGFSFFDDTDTLATWLDDGDYRTALIGKYLNRYWQETQPNPYIPPGWDSWHAYLEGDYNAYSLLDADPGDVPTVNSYDAKTSTTHAACAPGNYYMTDQLCVQASEFLAGDLGRPFFLYFAPGSPHEPYTPARRWKGYYNGLPLPRYPNYNVAPSPNPPSYLPSGPLDDTALRRVEAQFRSALEANRAVDDAIHALYEQLRTDGRLSSTVFVFISDNGLARAEHRWQSKACAYEECHRVPFVVVCPPAICPGATAGSDLGHFALNVDVAPTIVELAGIISLPMDGRSLVPILNGTVPPWRSSFVFDDLSPLTKISGIIVDAEDGNTYKYVESAGGREFELFDLTADPWELANLANDGVHGAIQNMLDTALAAALTPPTITLTSGGGSTDQTAVTLTWESDEEASFSCALDGSLFVPCGFGTSGSITYTDLTEGTHTFDVRATDAENEMSILTETFSVDLTPPMAPVLTSVPGDPSGASVSFSFSSDESGINFLCSIDDQPREACTSPKSYAGLADGSHTFSVQAVDGVQHVSAATSFTWTVEASADTTPPTLTMKAPATDAILNGTAIRASWSGSDDVGIVRYEVYERVGTQGMQVLVQSDLATSYSRTGDLGATYCYQVLAYDSAGNVGVGPERCVGVPLDDRSSSVVSSGAVTQIGATSAYQGTLTVLDGAGQQVELTFTGRRVVVLARKGPTEGKVEVWIDGTLRRSVDLYFSSVRDKVFVFSASLTYGRHTLTLVWEGAKNIASSGTQVSLDGIGYIE